VDVIVLDHHQISSRAGGSGAVNPQLELGTPAPELAAELARPTSPSNSPTPSSSAARKPACPARRYDLRPLLDLVALGFCGHRPLTGENRISVSPDWNSECDATADWLP
jgi:hypothetical protein